MWASDWALCRTSISFEWTKKLQLKKKENGAHVFVYLCISVSVCEHVCVCVSVCMSLCVSAAALEGGPALIEDR